ncbi:uncharacterized protein Dwil_GK15554 [Drosophila willistoni]|uniref:adenylate cyclase n=1 Tax=Drosophila willistoni TaxID=7260 RepID=B4MWX8_DROWI|nr:adenylyl cyclase X E [Drosophila willistoni]EDW76617.2 uncharacterized protein Dwil_GK15554 [Drosophila willistoni]
MSKHRFEKCSYNYGKEYLWESSTLTAKCKELGLEKEYYEYVTRLRLRALGIFVILHTVYTFVHCILLLSTSGHPHIIYIDVCCYMIAYTIFISVLSINFFEEYVTKRPWLMYLSSVIATVVWVGVDLTLNMYHYYVNDWLLTSIYDSYSLYMIYMFLPMPLLVGPLLLGTLVSILYVTYFMTYVAEKFQYELTDLYTYNYMSVDLSHYICFNLLGTFFRLMSDIIVRSSFLDRHQYVMENIWLRSARHQEKMLLHNILPPQIARPIQDEMRSRIAQGKKGVETHHRLFDSSDRIMAVQIHPEVTILYADVVNYTQLTTTLTVEKLVTLLHDLYGRFDLAASHFRVQRIKFLGDCYYCVAGLIRPNPDHAKCCVDLGLSMIAHIKDVRQERQLDIGMRIGVHSGNLFAGVIGEAKLQYDVWGQDVTIANRLESTGLQGHVHISGSTLMNLDADEYVILPGTPQAANDPFLQMHNISTYLVQADNSYRASTQTIEIVDSVSILNLRSRPEGSIENAASRELHEEFRKMPLGARNIGYFLTCREAKGEHTHVPNLLTMYFLHFRDPSLEWKYMRQPDYMYKYSLLFAWCIGVSLVYIQLVDHSGPNIYCFLSDFVVILLLSSFLFVSWYKKICWWRYGKATQGGFGRFSCLMFRIKDTVQKSLSLRISVYLFIIIAYYQILGIIVVDCNREEYAVLHIENKLYQYEMDVNMCFRPWVLTNMVALIMGVSFTFTRIPFLVKTLVSCIEATTYLVILFFQYEYVFHHSTTTNPFYNSEYAHCTTIIVALITLYLKERQTEFNSKINYHWRTELKKKQRDAHLTNVSITVLLNNILPAHVVNVYLTSLAKHELYYENYSMVAVMFASLHNFPINLHRLRILNEIITEFDRVLLHYKEYFVVEKIKIVSCTYMAACGLDVNFAGSISRPSENPSALVDEVERARKTRATFISETDSGNAESDNHDEVVFVMATFALDLLRTLWAFNSAYKELRFERAFSTSEMSIGISSGQVMAGVVGASQPHYDIWGNPVNMASRMDSTGLDGHIQVTEETANILKEFGLECIYRGMTYVKGPGLIPTYFVAIDSDYNFIESSLVARHMRSGERRTTIVNSMVNNEYSLQPSYDSDKYDD